MFEAVSTAVIACSLALVYGALFRRARLAEPVDRSKQGTRKG